MNYFSICSAYAQIGYQVYWKNKRHTMAMLKELVSRLNISPESLSKKLENRIYYYTAQCAIVASWTSSLHGRPLRKSEYKLAAMLGAFTPLIDDLSDDLKMDSGEILDALQLKTENKTTEFKIAHYLFKELHQQLGDSFLKQFRLVLKAQTDSLKQLESAPLAKEELEEITYNKGAMSILLYRSILENPLREGEEEAFKNLGYATQIINDQFDVHKDKQNKVQSLYTNATDLRPLEKDYRELMQRLLTQFEHLPYPKKNKKQCLAQISTILGRGMVCLEQLLALQKRDGIPFNLSHYNRKELICDMEKPSNMHRSIQHSTKLLKNIS